MGGLKNIQLNVLRLLGQPSLAHDCDKRSKLTCEWPIHPHSVHHANATNARFIQTQPATVTSDSHFHVQQATIAIVGTWFVFSQPLLHALQFIQIKRATATAAKQSASCTTRMKRSIQKKRSMQCMLRWQVTTLPP